MPSPQSRTVSLPSELEQFIEERGALGAYATADAVISDAIARLRDERSVDTKATAPWLIGGGSCGAMIRERDWSPTPLGSLASWPGSLRATVNNIVNSPVAKVLMWGSEHVMLYNDAYSVIAGDNHPRALGGTVREIWPEIWDFNKAMLATGFRGEVQSLPDQSMVLNRYGKPETAVFDLFYTPVYDDHGAVGGVMCTVLENTEKVAAQRLLAWREAELRTVTDAMPILISYIDRDLIYRFANSYYETWTGRPRSEIIGRSIREVMGNKLYLRRAPMIARALAGEDITVDDVMPHTDGPRRAEIRYIPRIEADGSVPGFHVMVFDIEERVRRAEALEREAAHRARAEGQLRHLNETLEARVIQEIEERRQTEAVLAQSQKMETIGKLTGGVAHDFNNLLQVVSGNLQLLAFDVAGNARAEKRVTNAMAGVSRGAKLAAQLLAFGRRQALEPKVVNVTRFVRGMDDMLRRAIGEGIEIETIVGGGLWNTFVDPAQIENALLNLAINARDAMDGQGKLTIELGNASLDDAYARTHAEVTPGQYVMLAVSDTGTGMSPDIIDKVFEPFFSTKSEGKGSGLGLSMVYGLVKQSGGHVKIYSELGEGTTIKLYLPRAMASEDLEVAATAGPIVGGTETVLVVEDDDEVRATVVEMLGELGYQVLKAVDAGSALSVIESGIPIDMLFTDVVMPGQLKSPELARRARERLPDLAVLFTSGYTENSIVHGGKLDAGIDLLSKPYTREALARKFEQMLAGQRARRGIAEPGATPLPPADPASSARPMVLLVEDDAMIRADTAAMLEASGVGVVEAASAEDAAMALQTAAIDVLVTDVNLPGMSGPELASRARTLRPTVGIVFATGDAEAVAGLEDARTIVLAKPYDADALKRAVRVALGRPELVALDAPAAAERTTTD